jgi:predicted RND superfamily exporter protein
MDLSEPRGTLRGAADPAGAALAWAGAPRLRLRGWASFWLARPRLALALFAALSACWLAALPRLRLQTDGRSLFSPRHPAVRFQEQVERDYASSNFVVVGIAPAAAGEVFSPAPLNLLLRLSREVADLPGVAGEQLRSLATARVPAWSAAGLRLAPPLAEPVAGAREAAAVRAAAASEPLFHGVLVGRDGRALAMYVPLAEQADRPRVFHQIQQLVAGHWRAGGAALAGFRPHLMGPAAAEALLGEYVMADLERLLPLSFAIVAAILWLWFRRASVVLVGLGEGLAVVLWTFGLMGLLGRPITLVTVIMPVILVAYCVADSIHIAQYFSVKCRPGDSDALRRRNMERTLDEALLPVTFTSLATAAGFLAFALSPIPPLREFGLFSAFGIVFTLAVSALVVPAALLLSGFGRRRAEAQPPASRGLERLTVAAARAPRRVIAALALGALLVGAGAARLEVQDSWLQNFGAGSALVRSDRWFNRSFVGSNVLNVVVGRSGESAAEPELLAAVSRLQGRLAALPEVGGSLSLADQLRSVSRCLEGRPRLPRSLREAEEWELLLRMAGGEGSLAPYLDARSSRLNLWVFLNQADYRKTAAVLQAVARFDWGLPGPRPAVHPAGDAYLGYLLVDSIGQGQQSSALIALLVTFAAVWWMVRSVPSALMAVLPVTLSVCWNFGFMGWAGMPLGVATSTFCAIALGVGVDFAIHWLARLRIALHRGLAWEEALRWVGATTGGAILLQGYVVLFGFGVLVLSSAPPTRRLGVVLCVNLAACLGASLVLLPAIASLMRRHFEAQAGQEAAPAAPGAQRRKAGQVRSKPG